MNDQSLAEDRWLVFRRLEEPITLFGNEFSGMWWLAVLIPVLVLAVFYVVLMYVKDGRAIGWIWATILGVLRCCVYGLLALAFLLPVHERYEVTKQTSRVLVVFDTSVSMIEIKDELPTKDRPVSALPTRMDKVLQFLAREAVNPRTGEKTSFFRALEAKNPVFLYRFGGYLDDEFVVRRTVKWTDDNGDKKEESGLHLTKAEWDKLRTEGGDRKGEKWGADKLAAWLKPDLPFKDGDGEEVRARKARDQVRFSSTNVGASVLDLLKREGNNMVQGVVVFSDGRSTDESPQAFRDLAALAKDKKVPVFVVKVGEDRPKVELDVVDVRVPIEARPDDVFPVTVEVRAKGMRAEQCTVVLDVYKPKAGADAKDSGEDVGEPKDYDEVADALAQGKTVQGRPVPFKSIPMPVKFSAAEPIKAEAKFLIDPKEFGETGDAPKPDDKKPDDKKPDEKKPDEKKPDDKKDDKKPEEPAASGKPLLRQGEWRFVARVQKDPREIYDRTWHVAKFAPVQVTQKPLRVLLFASAPTRDYQFIRTLFVREKDKRRVDLTIHVQAPPGQSEPRKGVVQDVDPERLLPKFPDLFQDASKDTEETKLYNLANYDVIVAFDPDWRRLADETLTKVNGWVKAGGGLVVVGGAVNTIELARDGLKKNEGEQRLKKIREVYAVELQDSRIQDLERPTIDPWRLKFNEELITTEMEFLNLEELKDKEDEPAGADKPLLTGWEEFFTGRKLDKGEKPDDKVALVRGFYNFYPVEKAKKGTSVLATFADPRGNLKDGTGQPYLVVMPIVGRGKSVWVGSGETWRLRQYREAYHERFWVKLARYAGSGNAGKQNSRVVPYIGKQFPANSVVHIEAQIRDKNQDPLRKEAKPRLILRPQFGEGKKDDEEKKDKDAKDTEPEFVLKGKETGSDKWDGWFEADFPVRMPGKYRYLLKIDETGEDVSGEFDVLPSDPERDNTSPDVRALYFDLASDANDLLKRVDSEVGRELRERLQRPVLSQPKDKDKAKDKDKEKAEAEAAARDTGLRLYFDFTNADLIPKCMGADEKTQKNRTNVEEWWDGKRLPLLDWESPYVSWTLLLVVFLFCLEWLARKLLRLA